MKSVVVLLILFCLCQEIESQRPKPKPKPKPGPSTNPNYGCPRGWKRFRDSDRCYFISVKIETFDGANEYCIGKKAMLIPPLQCDAHIDLNNVLADYRTFKCGGRAVCNEYWIGIRTGGAGWETVNGLGIERNGQCQQWGRGYPQKNLGNCTMLSFRSTRKHRGVWRNAKCDRKLKFICIACPNDFEYLPDIDECVNFITTPANWSTAQLACSKIKKRAMLLTIQYLMKQEAIARFVRSRLQNATACAHPSYTQLGIPIWTGGQTKIPNVCQTPYVWKPIAPATAIPFDYTNWFSGMPNCGKKRENCMAMATAPEYAYRWDDFMCSESFCYSCEF